MKNITAFDIETTGLNKNSDHVIQISLVKMDGETYEEIDSFTSYVKPIGKYTMGLGAYFKHKITPEMLEDKPTLIELAPRIQEFFTDCDILTYNGNSFDIPFLINDFKSCGVAFDVSTCNFYDAFLEEKKRHGNRLCDVYKKYYGETMENDGLTAHNAMSDVYATISVFKAQQSEKHYDAECPLTVDNFIKLSEFNGEENVPCFCVGKYRDVAVSYINTVDPGYISWVIQKSDVAPTTKTYIANLINEQKN